MLIHSCSREDDKKSLQESKLLNLLLQGNDSLATHPASTITILGQVISQTMDSTTYHKALMTKGKAYFLL